MSSIQKGLRRAGVGGLSAILATTAMTGFASMASATSTFAFDRVQGSDRYVTSVATAKVFGASTNVILASGEKGHFPDALAASYLAGRKSAPVMLTKQATTPPAITAQIAALGTKNIWIVGGIDVVSAAQEATLAKTYTVKRLGGSDRFVTAAAVIADGGVATTTTAVLATGRNFPDALGGGALSYAKKMPLAITQTNILPTETLAALKVAGTTHVIILGGPDVVGANVVAMLTAAGITSQRIFGVDRADTSAALAEYELTQGFSATAVNVASGYTVGDGVDALGGAALSGQEARPLLITDDQTRIGTKLEAYLKGHAATLNVGHIFGGFDALSQKSQDTMTADAKSVVSNQTFTVTGAGSATVTDAGTRQYTVTGLDNTKTYTVALFDGANVTSTTGGQVSFVQTTPPTAANGNIGSGVADATGASGTLTVINGTSVSTKSKADVSPVNGTITLTVTGPALGTDTSSVVPVIYNDANASSSLNVDKTTGLPTEAFGVGGATTFVPAEAINAFSTAVTVTSVGTSSFTGFDGTNTFTFNFDANDVYRVDGAASTQATFVKDISVGDTVTPDYATDAAASSTFALVNKTPATVAAPTVAPTVGSTQTSLTVTFLDANFTSGYTVYRATSTSSTAPAIVSTTSNPFAPYVKVGTVVDTNATSYKFIDSGLTSDTFYSYAVVSNSPGADSAAVLNANATSTAGVATAAPKSVFAAEETVGGLSGTVDAGDVIKVAFDKAITLSGTKAVQLKDADGSVYTITATTIGTNDTTIALAGAPTVLGGVTYPANQVVVITIGSATGGMTLVTAGTVTGLQYPATIVDESGIAGTGGAWNIAGSTDVTVEQ